MTDTTRLVLPPAAAQDRRLRLRLPGVRRPVHVAAARERPTAAAGPLAPKPPHFPARAKRVIFLCMEGGPSHVDTFDYKPKLDDRRRQGRSRGRGSAAAKLLAVALEVQPARQERAVDLASCSPRSPSTPTSCACSTACTPTCRTTRRRSCSCTPAASSSSGRALGAWVLYGLGHRERRTCPASSRISPPASNGGAAELRQRVPAGRLPGHARSARRRGRSRDAGDRATSTNPQHARRRPAAAARLPAGAEPRAAGARAGRTPSIEGVIESYELAFRMQGDAAEADGPVERDRRRRSELYGIGDAGDRRLRPAVPAGPAVRRGGRAVRRGHATAAGTSTAT